MSVCGVPEAVDVEYLMMDDGIPVVSSFRFHF